MTESSPTYRLPTAIAMIVGICIGSGIFFKSDNLIPGTYGFKSQADYILTDYLNGCAYNESYTLTAYNARMKKLGMKPLTNLTSDMEDGK